MADRSPTHSVKKEGVKQAAVDKPHHPWTLALITLSRQARSTRQKPPSCQSLTGQGSMKMPSSAAATGRCILVPPFK